MSLKASKSQNSVYTVSEDNTLKKWGIGDITQATSMNIDRDKNDMQIERKLIDEDEDTTDYSMPSAFDVIDTDDVAAVGCKDGTLRVNLKAFLTVRLLIWALLGKK